jgi:hypothetical protein
VTVIFLALAAGARWLDRTLHPVPVAPLMVG